MQKVDAEGNCPEHGHPAWAIESGQGKVN
jgi:hypothetical protein